MEAAAGAPEGRWLRAERQTGGRGRQGRAWVSPAGNLHASTIVRLRDTDPAAPTLALVAGIAVHDAASLWVLSGQLFLKWPNDLLAPGGGKLAGMLLERSGDAVVLGIGVNLEAAPQDLGRGTASFADLGVRPPEPAILLDALAEIFATWLRRWREEGLDAIRRAWLVRAHAPGTPLLAAGEEGLFDGLAPDGALRLRGADGGIRLIHAGDVFLL